MADADFEIIKIYDGRGSIEQSASTDEIKIGRQVHQELLASIKNNGILEQELMLFCSSDSMTANEIVKVGEPKEHSPDMFYDKHQRQNDPKNAFAVIKDRLAQGKVLVADFHNHPAQTGEVMRENGKPSRDGLVPSGSDFQLPLEIKDDFGVDMVRIIGGLVEGTPELRAFRIHRAPNVEERKQIGIFGSGDWSDDDFAVDIMYTDLGKATGLGLVTELKLAVK